MFKSSVISNLNKAKKCIALSAMMVFGYVGFATIGIGIEGEGKKAKRNAILGDFTPIKTVNGFTLKSGPNYKGSMILSQQKNLDNTTFKSLMTYQKGNTTYILPYHYKIGNQHKTNSNLELIKLKVKMHH